MFSFFVELLALYVLINFIQYFAKMKSKNFKRVYILLFSYAFIIKAGFSIYSFNTGRLIIGTSFISPLERLAVNRLEEEFTVFIPVWAPYFIVKNNYRKYFNPNYLEYNAIKRYERECLSKVTSCLIAFELSVKNFNKFKSMDVREELKKIMKDSYESSKKMAIIPSCSRLKTSLETYQEYIKILNLKRDPFNMFLETHAQGLGELVTRCRGEIEPGLPFIVKFLVGINDLKTLESVLSYSCSKNVQFNSSCSIIFNTLTLLQNIEKDKIKGISLILMKVCSNHDANCPIDYENWNNK